MQTQFIDFNDLGFTVKLSWCSDRKIFEIICGTTYVGNAETVDGAKTVTRNWFNQISGN